MVNSATKKRHHFKNFGFSLIELLVAFTLISIISGVGFASFVDYSRTQIVLQATANLKQAVDVTRSNVSSFVKPEAYCGEEANLVAYKLNFCHNGGCTTGSVDYEIIVVCGDEHVIETFEFPDNVSAINVDGGSGDCNSLTFSVVGGSVDGAPCEVDVAGYGNQKRLSIDALGHATF